MDLTPGSGRSLEGEHGNLLSFSCLENPMNREVAGREGRLQFIGLQSQTGVKRLSTQVENKMLMT